jgi:hypothetical protein
LSKVLRVIDGSLEGLKQVTEAEGVEIAGVEGEKEKVKDRVRARVKAYSPSLILPLILTLTVVLTLTITLTPTLTLTLILTLILSLTLTQVDLLSWLDFTVACGVELESLSAVKDIVSAMIEVTSESCVATAGVITEGILSGTQHFGLFFLR